jgi:hypothetical protein
MDWLRDRDKWRDLVSTVEGGHFWTSWACAGFRRRAVKLGMLRHWRGDERTGHSSSLSLKSKQHLKFSSLRRQNTLSPLYRNGRANMFRQMIAV